MQIKKPNPVMKQQFAIFDFDEESYPITKCIWNNWDGKLIQVVAELPHNESWRTKPKMDFVFDVVSIDEHEILLEGAQNKQFTAKILLG